jgi:tetratricopeptide (TPR) repeat protein
MDVKRFLGTEAHPVLPGSVFVMLPEKCKDIYYGHVKQATESLGLQCESFLDRKSPEDALQVVVEGILKAEILIYDITDFTPNVMWELGVGSALKDAEKVIVIREASKTQLPFNIYSNRVTHQYDPESQESLSELSRTLKEVLQKIRSTIKPPRIKSPEVISLFKGTLDAVEKGQWVTAEALFQIMDSKEPKNWYIYNQWGMMLRAKGDEFEAATDRFNKALTFTEFEDDKAFVYTELGVLNQKSRKYTEAEDWFKRAERADSKNSRLYIAWAEYYDELGDYFNAQAKIGGALGLLRLKDDDPEYKEFMIRHEYYGRKILGYRKTLEIYLREKARDERKPPLVESKPVKQNGSGSPSSSLPYDINWQDLLNNYVNAVVEGEISNINAYGVFVRLSREFTGLVYHRSLNSDYGERYSRNQRVKVRITRAFVDDKDQRPKIDLRLVG